MSHDALYLGLDIGGTKCAAVVGDASGQALDRVEWPSHVHRGPQPMLEELLAHARSLRQKHPQIRAAGVSIGGPLDAQRGVILSPPNLPGWDNIHLKDILRHELHLPVQVEHDAAACCLAEHRWGAGQGATRLLYLTCGTGFGAGIVLDGQIYRGAGGRNVEIGHARYRDDGPEAFGKRGSFESFCAGASLSKLAAWKFPQRWNAAPPSPRELAELARNADAQAIDVLSTHARATGDACALLGDLLRPDRILLGSLAQHLGPMWVDQVRLRFQQESLPQTIESCQVTPTGLGPRLQDCSALVVAIEADELVSAFHSEARSR